jgi:uncharacterized membrane protein (UPF0136 family)
MNLGYSTETVLGNFDAMHPVLLVSYALVLFCFVLYYIFAIIKGFKDKRSGMPWQTNMWNMSNDFCFVFLGFPYWWTPGLVTNHWFTHIIWVGMVAWFIAEIIVHFQAIKWDMDDMFPHAKSKRNAILLYIGTQIVVISFYYWLWATINDPLVQIMISTTVVGCTLFVPPMLKDRNSTKGISAVSLWVVLIAQIAWWFVAMPAMDATLGNIYTYFFGICATAVGIGSLVRYYAIKKQEEEEQIKE